MKLNNLNTFLIFTILVSVMTLFSCSKKQDWSTKSDKALQFFLEGREYQDKFNREMATKYYRKAFSDDTTFAIAAILLVDNYINSGKIDSARYFLKKSVQLKNITSRYEQLIINHLNNKFKMNDDKAKVYEDSLLNEFPNKFDVKLIKAQKAFNNEEYSLSREMYLNVLEEKPDYVMAYNMVAYSYTLQGYYRDAYDYFYKYMQLAPNILNPYDSMAEFYMMTGKYHESISLLEKLVAERQDLLTQNKFLATVITLKIADGYAKLGQYDKSIEFAAKAKEMYHPVRQYHQINYFRYFLYKSLDDVNSMEEEYNWFKDRTSNFLSTYFGILLEISKYNYSSAEKRINDFCSKNQNKDKYYIRFLAELEAELAFAQERYAVAADKFKSASAVRIGVYPEELESKIYISLGLDGNYPAAIKGFLKILNKNPNHPTSLYYISQFYFDNGNTEKAKSYLNHFLTLWENADADAPLLVKARDLEERLNLVQ